MANHMTEVAKLLGVELGKSFEISDIPDGRVHLKWQRCYRLSSAGIELSNDNVHWEKCTGEVLEWLLMGEIGIKLPWKPDMHGSYYSPLPTNEDLWGGNIWTGSVHDIRRLKYGLVFKTKEEAVMAAKKMLAAINEQ